MSEVTYGYMWFMRTMESPCNCLTITGVGPVYKSWHEIVGDMESSLGRMEVDYYVNPECNPEGLLHAHTGEMVYATFENNYGSYIVKLVAILE